MPDLGRALSRSERRKARTTEAILDAAERHFLERGFATAKVDEIAEEADVAVGSVYNHFGGKERLYGAVLERALALFEHYVDEEPRLEGSALEQLLDLAGRIARFGRERRGHLRLLVLPPPREVAEELSETLRQSDAFIASLERRVRALIEAAARSGEAMPLDSPRAATFLWSAWMGALVLGERSDAELRAVLEAGLRVTLGGVASDEARERSELVRAILESASAPATTVAEERRQPALGRAPVLGSLRTELPGLALWTAEVAVRPGPSPQPVRRRLETLAGRITTLHAEGARRESVPWSYRVLVRHLGQSDPAELSFAETVAVGTNVEVPSSAGLPDDALAIAALETGVPLLAFDSAKLRGDPALRRARAGERLGPDGDELDEGRVVIADHDHPIAVIFGEKSAETAVTRATANITLAAIQAKGVPNLAVEEAVWTAVEILREPG